jgi:hypothetical protein
MGTKKGVVVISRRHAIVSNFLLRRHAGAGTWDADLGGLNCDQKKRVRWKIANGKTRHVLRMAACTMEILRNRADRGRSPHIERSVAIVRSKSRSPYIFMGWRPVEGFTNIVKKKQTCYFRSYSYVPFCFVRFLFFRLCSCLPSSEITVLGPILVAASIKRDLDAA